MWAACLRRALAAALCLIAVALSAPMARAEGCADLTPGRDVQGAQHHVQADDILQLRDIGEPDGAFEVSPDGNAVAFQLRRADAKTNSYCYGIYVLGLGRGASLVTADVGGKFVLDRTPLANKPAVPVGIQTPETPLWSPDGHFIAYLRRDDETTRLWLARADGSGAAAQTAKDVDVSDFAWTSDGSGLIFATHPGLAKADAAIVREGLAGWHFDDRVVLSTGARPIAVDPLPTAIDVIEIASSVTRPATGREKVRLESNGSINDANGTDHAGLGVWVATNDLLPADGQVWLRAQDGTSKRCDQPSCRGWITGAWRANDGRAILFMRREGYALAATGIYRWTPGKAARRLLETEDVLTDCQIAKPGLVCLDEASEQPRRLVILDTTSGALRSLFDPNPEWRNMHLGRVQRLHWVNDRGLETIGDLVTPPDYRVGRPLPLVVVQYATRGFLRGGVGDEFPIQLLAAQGFAVLSFQNPQRIGEWLGATDAAASFAADQRDFANRRSILSSLERGVQLLIDRGIADPKRIGLTGLSDGAVTVQYALLHSQVFSVFATASCCMDRSAMAFTWQGMGDLYRRAGWPRISDTAPDYAANFFVIPSAYRLNRPILVQTSDAELGYQVEVLSALRELDKPVDTYVFPGEFHIKAQPAHRLAAYNRYVQWFDFWLQDRRDPDPVDGSQYDRWAKWVVKPDPRFTLPVSRMSSDRPRPRRQRARAISNSRRP
jgi:dipeptidyl aminopeptidase/acylaminoacyl peptidase